MPKSVVVSKINEHGELDRATSPKDCPVENEWDDIPPEYYNLGFYLVIPLLLGLTVGLYLDKRFATSYNFTLTFITLGTVSVFYNLYKLYADDGSTHKHKR